MWTETILLWKAIIGWFIAGSIGAFFMALIVASKRGWKD